MKNIIILLFIIITPVSLSTQESMELNNQEPMKLVYYSNYPPFSWLEDGQMKGILIDVLTEAIQNRMNIPVSHEGYPWARAQYMVKTNDADAFATVPTEERRNYTEISSEPVIQITFTIFLSKNSTMIDELKKVETVSGLADFCHVQYIGSGWAKQNLKDMNVYWTPVLEKALLHIAENRFDVFIDTSQVIRFNIKKLGYQDRIIELPNIIDSNSFNLCIGKDSPFVSILPEFNETIIKLREDGSLQEIYNKYK